MGLLNCNLQKYPKKYSFPEVSDIGKFLKEIHKIQEII